MSHHKRLSSVEKIPKLDLSKAAPFANLPDPYAYLREEMEAEEAKKNAEAMAMSQTKKSCNLIHMIS